MNLLVTILLAVLIFGVIIIIHELGHGPDCKGGRGGSAGIFHRHGSQAVPD